MPKEKDPVKLTVPLCWTCKHGICVKQTSAELIPPMPTMAGHEEAPQEPWQKSDAAEANKDNDKQLMEVTYTKFVTICYWKPTKTSMAVPTQFDFISECSRYEKKSS
jgi:hypothetical protein